MYTFKNISNCTSGYGTYPFLVERLNLINLSTKMRCSAQEVLYVYDKETELSFTINKENIFVSFQEKWIPRKNDPGKNDKKRVAIVLFDHCTFSVVLDEFHNKGHLNIDLEYACSPNQSDYWRSTFLSEKELDLTS